MCNFQSIPHRLVFLAIFVSTLSLNFLSGYGQQEEVYMLSGTVFEAGTKETLIGVNVTLTGRQKGTVTNAAGFYSIELPKGTYQIKYSYVGYTTQELTLELNANRDKNIYLEPAETEINEVQITAQRKFFGNMDYGRVLPSIGTEEIENQSINNASDILHARIAGVWATKTSGAPGDQQKVRIRGQNSFFSSAEPLYVVDGVPVPIVNMSSLGIGDLNIHDIENVTVLRDASSASLYGYQGGNGVVLIDTKKGGGETKFNFISRFGYQWPSGYYDIMNTNNFLTSLDSAYSKMRLPLRNRYPDSSDTLCYRDWQREFLSPSGMQEYQLSASGSVYKTSYYLSGNYLDQEGILAGTNYNRKTIAARISQRIGNRLALDIGYRGSWQSNENNQNEYKGNRLLLYGINKAPCLTCTPDSLLINKETNRYFS